ncbi:glycosyltransferase [Enterococcus sp. AZ196]|uniref:glycosyltransferase n=1 Tax=Enterococcus sp. AZ196 TaxID=2774659 RepID=UPI003D2C2224
MVTPLVSIVIPVYNVELYLKEALDSIINQSYKNLEIIIVNDGSTDNSKKIIDDYVHYIPNKIISVTKKNQGLSSARNTGLKYVKGKYIYFFDSDDILKSNCIETLVNFCELNKLEICRFEAISFVNDDIEQNIDKNKYTIKSSLDRSIVPTEIYVSNPLKVRMPVWLYFYSSRIIFDNELMFEKGILHEDELFTPQILSCTNRIGLLSEVFFYRRIRRNSIMNSQSNNDEKGRSLRKISHILVSSLEENGRNEKIDSFIKFRIFRCFSVSVYLLGDLKKIGKKELNKLGIKHSSLVCWIWLTSLRNNLGSVLNDK